MTSRRKEELPQQDQSDNQAIRQRIHHRKTIELSSVGSSRTPASRINGWEVGQEPCSRSQGTTSIHRNRFAMRFAQTSSPKGRSRCTPSRIYSTRGNGLGFSGGQALSAIIGNGSVDDGTAIHAFPCIKHEKEIRKPFQHHQSFTLWTFHWFLPEWLRSQLMQSEARAAPNRHMSVFHGF